MPGAKRQRGRLEGSVGARPPGHGDARAADRTVAIENLIGATAEIETLDIVAEHRAKIDEEISLAQIIYSDDAANAGRDRNIERVACTGTVRKADRVRGPVQRLGQI